MYLSRMKIIFLVIASEDPVHQNDLLAQTNTWVSSLDQNSRVVWLRGHSGLDFKFESDTLYVPCAESYQNILEKTVLGIRYIEMNLDFDIIIRTNVSTYFHIRKLRHLLTSPLFEHDFFGGFIEKTKGAYFGGSVNYKFISGTGIFLSRAAVSKLTELNYLEFEGVPDDVAISHFLMHKQINRIPMTRSNLSSTHVFFPSYFTRAKSSSDPNLASKRMHLLYDFYNQNTLYAKAKKYLQISALEFDSFLRQPEPISKYFLKNRMIISSFIYAKGFRIWRRLKLR
jgi:hypothetical protein